MEYLKILESLPRGWDKDAHYHLFCLISYMDEVIRIWLQKLKLSKYFKELIFNTPLFADDQLIIADTEDNLQRAVYLLLQPTYLLILCFLLLHLLKYAGWCPVYLS